MTHDTKMKTGDSASGRPPTDRTKNETEDSFGAWLAIGVGLGVVFGVLWDNIGVGVALGACLGIVMESVESAAQRRRKGS